MSAASRPGEGGLLPWLATLEPLHVPFPDVDDDLLPLDEPDV